MKISHLMIHNFRSLADVTLDLYDYALLVGENNTGKTSVLTALRCFYEDGAKFSREVDFPKFPVEDKESWMEIHYKTTPEEQETLKKEYRSDDNVLGVRRYFQSDDDLVKANQSNIYGYENGTLSRSLFYGAKNISQAKLGAVIYVPEVSKTDDTLKLSGPSPFRDMVNFVMNRAVSESKSFDNLRTAFDNFNDAFKQEASADGFSVNSLIEEINANLNQWQIRFGVDVNALRPEDIVKSLLAHYIEDLNLDGKRVHIGSYGQGLQRHVIYTMIRLSTRYAAPKKEKKKNFAPDFTLLLFEEPEAFLHPSQQDRLNASLRQLSLEEGQQVLVTTHSPHFVSKQVNELTSIIRLHKPAAKSMKHQLSDQNVKDLIDENLGLYKRFCDLLQDNGVSDDVKASVRRRALGEDIPRQEAKLEEEAVRFLLWLNAERAAIFFAKHVIICEGPSEKVLFEYLIDQKWPELRDRNVYFADAMGKFSIHRFMGLLNGLGIQHSVLMDRDRDADIHGIVNAFIEAKRTPLTKVIACFDKDLEDFLGIPEAPRRDLKPLHVVSQLRSGKITDDKIKRLRDKLEGLL